MQMGVLESCVLHTTIVLAAPTMKRFRSQKPWRLLFPYKPVHKKKVQSGLKCKSTLEHPKPIQIPSLSHHYHLRISQSERSRLKVIRRILPLAIAIKLPQRAVNLPQPYARFWLWRILRPQLLCAMLPWSSLSSSWLRSECRNCGATKPLRRE
jgi:hypothetical protein